MTGAVVLVLLGVVVFCWSAVLVVSRNPGADDLEEERREDLVKGIRDKSGF